MSLLNTWTSRNRIVTRDLKTVYNRILFGDSGKMYWLYTRERTKEYEYISMTRATATLCAKAMNTLYNRRTLDQEWYDAGTVPNPSSCWKFITGNTAQDRSYNPTNVYIQNVTNSVVCGTAEPQHDYGCAWKVVVTVDEKLSYNYRPINCTDMAAPLPWTEFENDPTAAHAEFYGCISDKNENYDTADNGYGSPT